MALGSTVYNFEVALSDMDRGVYESLSLKVACHPSETSEYMLSRVLAYALELQEGISFTQGLAVAEDPAIWVRDLTGRLQAWIEIGTPDLARLHKASKACERVLVYCHKDTPHYLRSLYGQRVYAPDRIEIVELDPELITLLAEKIQRRTALNLTLTEGQLYLDIGGDSFTTTLVRHPFPRAI